MTKLAISGGKPFRDNTWPKWPFYTKETERLLCSVLSSGRWSVKEAWTGTQSKTQDFAEKFSKYLDVPYCVPVASGSAGLIIALESLDIGVGDEVIIPALTWIATPVSVINVNARPVLVDIDPDTACISCDAIEAAITRDTKAILPVHYLCSMADMKEVMRIAYDNDLFVIEDCAQACGSSWDGKRAGTMGDLGVFSMNQEKVLACGEGGAVVTKDSRLYDRLVRLRTDGSNFSSDPPRLGESEFVDLGGLQGANYCLSEFQAAVLVAQLNYLSEQNDLREKNARYLDHHLAEIQGLRPLKRPLQLDKRTYNEYVIVCDSAEFCNKPVSVISEALKAELGVPMHQIDPPLNRNVLYCPLTKRRHRISPEYFRSLDISNLSFEGAERAFSQYIAFHHRFLLGTTNDMNDIVQAFEKVSKYAEELPNS